ncbi:hypothetical protein N657DRAFT_665986 [Parathielavia appendiculata]|uniref:Uncharacterized protein n=1 Tax=Parathielavia appendiculata TaxID=2587402 RepID=A0AAN6TTY9_9PEZI|nr:hypothetical protein N657DRAFT_665986 [Parathielavia appendiculata]
MNGLTVAGAKYRRLVTRQTLFIALSVCTIWFFGMQFRSDISQRWSGTGEQLPEVEDERPDLRTPPKRMPTHNILPPLSERVLCHGPRGHLLGKSRDDDLEERELDGPYPTPWAGNYEETGLDLTMMNVDQRYGPYGFGEDKDDYGRKKVDWDSVDWGQLQNDCFERNRHRFPASAVRFDDARTTKLRLSLRDVAKIPEIRHWHEFEPSRRTAIVVRTWRGYQYMPEDMYYLRSLIAETSLKSGAEYQVILLVDMKDSEGYDNDIFSSEEAYKKGLEDAGVPPELQSIALLWNVHLLDSWYPLIQEHRTMWQVFQPIQLLALHYPEFDHFWQLEMDVRFMGDAGKFLDRLTATARNEPRKQALERSSFWHMIAETGDYGEFFRAVDMANRGGSHAWGPVHVREILPIGPEPPVRDPRNDTFQWGVGEEADVITTSYCMDANKPTQWVFREWIHGFETGLQTPRFYCPPAIQRASRSLLLVIHQAQLESGIRVPSEATLPSFALWHGLKLSFPQHPVFHQDQNNVGERRKWWRGGPKASSTGLGHDDSDHPRGVGLTFWWESDWAKHVFYEWMEKKLDEDQPRPWILNDWDGKLFVPNIVLHPVKHP